jgi:Tol biopolymer transport system component
VTLVLATLLAAVVATPIVLKKYFWTDQVVTTSTGKTMKSKRLVTSATGGRAGNTSISPDGKFVVYKDDEADRRQALWLKQVATGAVRQIVAPDDVLYRGTTFSLDGNLVYYVVLGTKYPSGALFQVPVIGGTAKQLLVNIAGPISLAPDGKQFSYLFEKSLMVANIDGTAPHHLASTHHSVAFSPVGPAWSPDGKLVAFGDTRDEGPYPSVFTVDVVSGQVRQITKQNWSSVRRLLWFADGSGLVLLASDLQQDFSQVWEISYPSGAVRRVTNDLNGHGHISLGLTSDSSTLVTQQEDDISHVWVMANGDSSNARQLTSGEGRTDGRFGLTWLRDGRLVYSSRVETGWNLWQIMYDGTQQQALTADAYRDDFPVATPDGLNIIFRSTRGTGTNHLWMMNSSGGLPKQLTTGENAEDSAPRVSSDGSWVIYSSRTAGQDRLWRVPLASGEQVRLTEYQSTSPDVSPDGKLIACVFRDETVQPARWRVGIIPFAGGPPIKTVDLPKTADISRSTMDGRAVTYVRWVKGGRALAYVDRQNGVSNIWSQPVEGGLPRQLTNFPSGVIFNFEFSPDGKEIACARGTMTSDVILISDFR